MSVKFTVFLNNTVKKINEITLDSLNEEEYNLFKEYSKLSFINLINVIKYRIFENIKIQNEINNKFIVDSTIDGNLDDFKNKNDKYMHAALNVFLYRKLYTDLLTTFSNNFKMYTIFISVH